MDRNVKVVVLATNPEGSPAFFHVTVLINDEQYSNGVHYDTAKACAEINDYEEPMIAFDENDTAARQLACVHAFMTGNS